MESQEQHLEENKTVEESPGTCTGNLDNDVAMDLFLSQMDCYNPQHLSRQDVHNTNTVLDHSHLFATGDSHNLDTNIHQLPDLDVDGQQFYEQDNANKADVTASSSSNRSKAKNKSKDSSGGSSLLNAIANPLLHAIPILARNCLNFEDFLAQAALHGQNGLMGPKMTKPEDGSSDYAAPDKLMLDPSRERPMAVKIESRYHIRVLGLPETGAKSRVETQIKICLQLVDSSNNLTTDWSHLRLPEHMVAKEKLKRKNQKAGDDKLAMLESKVLNLEAAVVCDGHPDNEIIMCTSCVHRERKRLKRKRDNKVARAANKEGNAAKLAALFATDLPDLNDEEVMALERRKILLFNCNEYVEFGDGEATLPTRVTCYCRHHSEKVGFRIVFTLKDSHNHVIATGRSPPIMITDDHKSSKVQSTARKRTRTEYDASASEVPEPPPGSKKKVGDGETDSGVSSPVTSAPPTPASNGDDMAGNSPSSDKSKDDDHAPAGPSATTGNDGQSVSSSNTSKTAGTSNQSLLSHVQQPSTYRDSIQEIPRGELFDLLHSENVNVDHLLSSSDLNAPQPQNQAQQQQTIPLLNPNERLNSLLQPQSRQHILSRRRTTVSPTCSQQQWQVRDIYAKMQQKNASDSAKSTNVPRLHRLIPSEGPIYGGSEVTVLGSNFYEGLTCLFGENPAIPTHCWSNNTLLCILPPAASAGPVVVSFKEHPLMLESQDVVLFTYIDESDRALMELALQVVGLKTMGRVEDARQIAMRIVQGDTDGRKDSNGKSSNSSLNGLRLEYRQHLTVKAAAAVYDNARTLFIQRLEDQVIAALVAAMCMDTRYSGELSLTNRNKHSLLHLATICGYDRLVRVLLKLGCDVDQSDSNGFTALHFASWTGKVDIVQALISRANLDARNIMGKTAERMALEAGHHKVLEIFKRAPRKRQNRRKSKDKDEENAVRIPLTELIPAETVASARAVLPTRLNDMLSTFYTISVNTQCVKNLGMAVTHVYNFMLDPF